MPSGAFVARRNGRIFVTGNSGFPKSHDISKAIDKAAGAEREIVGLSPHSAKRQAINGHGDTICRDGGNLADEPQRIVTAPATDAALQWDGWGTALKPAWEPIIMAMKPIDGTFVNNALLHGVAGINVDGCRIGNTVESWPATRGYSRHDPGSPIKGTQSTGDVPNGRWPANVLLDEEAAELLDQMSGERPTGGEVRNNKGRKSNSMAGALGPVLRVTPRDSGGASRFFYVAKASKRDRDEGLEGMPERSNAERDGRNQYKNGTPLNGSGKLVNGDGHNKPHANHHPTVKPTQLMRYLCKLVTRPGGVILDPFMGSGSTGKAAMLEGFNFVGIEIDPTYHAIATKRLEQAAMQPLLLDMTP